MESIKDQKYSTEAGRCETQDHNSSLEVKSPNKPADSHREILKDQNIANAKEQHSNQSAESREEELQDQKMANAEPKTSNKLAECYGEELPDIEQSLWDMFAKTAIAFPDKDAVVSLWQKVALPTDPKAGFDSDDDEGISLTRQEELTRWKYSDLHQAAELLAAWLQTRGCVQGTHLVASFWNSAEWALFFWAAARLKMVFVPIDPRVASEGLNDYIGKLGPHVFLVQDKTAAVALDEATKTIPIRICCAKEKVDGWVSLHEIFSSFNDLEKVSGEIKGSVPDGQETALIVFTSGTTSTPKGCIHTARSLWSQSNDFDPSFPQHIDKWLVHTPIWHVFAVNNALRAWRYGSCIVLPSKSFDITASLKALKHEKCTRMSAVPTLVRALIGHPHFPGKEELRVTHITIGGTTITEEDVKMCENFVTRGKALTAYGMSEGAPMVMWSRTDPLLQTGFYPGVGKVLPGSRMKICSPTTKKLLNRNELGELHIGGTSVIESYVGDESSASFYKDAAGSWLMTGDQGFIDDNDVLHITARLKDIIIRGGENIAPAKIEAHIMKGIPGLTAHVVGVPDEIAGEVPIAVVHSAQTCSKPHISDLAKELGPSYALSHIFTLAELDLKAFPVTATGKVRKDVLTKHVTAFLAKSKNSKKQRLTEDHDAISNSNGDTKSSAIVQTLLEIWIDLANVTPAVDDPVAEFSDSITLLRCCDRIWKALGIRVYLQDFQKHPSIALQADLLQRRDYSRKKQKLDVKYKEGPPALENVIREGPPSLADVIFVNQDSTRYHEIVAAAEKTLQGFGFDWQPDAEDIVPIRDFWHAIADGPRPQTYRHRTLFRLVDRTPSVVRAALEKGLKFRPMFRTLLSKSSDGTPFHVVVRESDRLYKHLIKDVEVSDVAAMQELYRDDSDASFSQTQMVQSVIVSIRETDTTYLILTYNHSVFDGISMIEWYRDIDRLILNLDAELSPLTPFRLFADIVHFSEYSPQAKVSVKFNVHRLRGISKYTAAFWPPQKAPGFMSGNDTGSPHHAKRLEYRENNNIIPVKPPLAIRMSKFPGLDTIRREHQIKPSIVVKTAVAIFNVLQTGQEYAIFNNLDDGREWPFILPWMKDTLPHPMTVDGPMMEWCLNMIRITPYETVGDLLQRMTSDQKELSAHVHAPWFKVLESLGEEASLVKDASRRQSYNWDVSLGTMITAQHDFAALQPLARTDWPDSGIYWVAGLLSKEDLCLAANFDDTQLSVKEIDDHINTILNLLRKMTEPGGWNSKVAGLLERVVEA